MTVHGWLVDRAVEVCRQSRLDSADLAVLVDGELALAVWYRDAHPPGPPAPPALIYSVTKTLLAAVVLMLVDEGRLSLDQPAVSVVPRRELPESITLRHLLNHTSGLPDYGADPAYQRDLRQAPHHPWTPERFLEHALARPLLFAPGTAFAYSNPGYLLLRQVIEVSTGQSLRSALHARLFAPLGLQRIGVVDTPADLHALTAGWSDVWSPGEPRDVRRVYHPGWVSHGVVAAPALEAARVLDAIQAGHFFSAELLRQMWRPVPVGLSRHPVFDPPGYGLGVMTDGRTRIGHGGGGPGYTAGAVTLAVDGRRVTSVALVHADRGEEALLLASELTRLAVDTTTDP